MTASICTKKYFCPRRGQKRAKLFWKNIFAPVGGKNAQRRTKVCASEDTKKGAPFGCAFERLRVGGKSPLSALEDFCKPPIFVSDDSHAHIYKFLKAVPKLDLYPCTYALTAIHACLTFGSEDKTADTTLGS